MADNILQILLESAASMGVKSARHSSKIMQDRYLLTFSASHPDALKKIIEEHEAYLSLRPERIADLSYTLNVRREPLQHRAFSVVSTEAADKPLQVSQFEKAGVQYELTYVFTGQGAQWSRMGASLFETSTKFRESIDEMELALASCQNPPKWSLTGKQSRQTERWWDANLSMPNSIYT